MSPAPSRLVRVFISSTFRDFMGERDELVKRVFPELRRRCRARFVELLEVDLRWGITEDQSRLGATLGICLREIDRCRPSVPVFFIGLLGERYGWIPEPVFYTPDVLENPALSWVKEHVGGKSVTELEILHGVLRNHKMRERAFFYFRREGYQLRHWAEIHEAYPQLEPADFTNERDEHPGAAARKQRALKQRILRAALRHPPVEYETPQDLAARVLESLWARIDEAFPASEVPDALEQESIDHRVFCASRTRAYVERRGLFGKLDQHAAGRGPIGRVVLGAPGGGKSALLAAWLARQADRVVFAHFVGATPQSVSAESILRRFFGTLRQRGVLPREAAPPADLAGLAAAVPAWLDRLAQAGGGVILFDALNQLGTATDRELKWWPHEWPDNIRIVFSTLPGDAWREMEARGWTAPDWRLTVPPLRPGEKSSIMGLYLKQFSRALEKPLQRQILAAPQTANPLFLRTVLDELRLRSAHEDLGRNLDAMLGCPDPAALFVHVLRNFERDFTPAEVPGMVHRALGLLGVARRGLSEGEMLELLSPAEQPARTPLPRYFWAPLYLALEDSLVSREGQLSFFHDYLRQAVWREYLDEAREREASHGRLAEPATRWREEGAFGASLQAYGYEHGIGHLLAVGRVPESLALLLEPGYPEAAARALRDPGPVLRDVNRVRRAAAVAGCSDAVQGASLTVHALAGAARLTGHLRSVLDAAARSGDWGEVMGLAAAGGEERMRLLLACRALARGGVPRDPQAAAQLRLLLDRWASADGKPEWQELVGRMLALEVH